MSGMAVGSISFGPMCNCTGECTKPGGRCPVSGMRLGGSFMPFPDPAPCILPGHSIVGTCSLCRGAVTVPTFWGGIIPPTPTCSGCGAIKKQNHGPVIDMEPRK